MAQISPKYASPGLRLGLLLHDHPNASYKFERVTGTDIGIPSEFGGDGAFCLATISFGDGRADASAWKPVPARGGPDDWNILQTKTLGRALKKAGYPDDLDDLKALVLWRQRDAEISAIASGTQQVAISSTSSRQAALSAGDAPVEPDVLEQAFDAAATPSSDDAIDAEVVPEDDDRIPLVEELVAGLDNRSLTAYKAYLKTIGATSTPAHMSDEQLTAVLAWLDPEGS